MPPTLFKLTVNSGTGSGGYLAGAVVAISASAPPAGKMFVKWTGDTASIANVSLASTELTMPASASTITATYMDVPSTLFSLTVNSGIGSGSYKAGTLVTVSATVPVNGMFFDVWKGDIAGVANVADGNTTYLMPASDVTIKASYTNVPESLFTLTVVDGSGSGSYKAGASVPINANLPAAGMLFDAWNGMIFGVSNTTQSNAIFTMPSYNASVRATYKTISSTPHTLTVENGSGGGSYVAGTTVALGAGLPAEGKTFSSWTGNIAGVASICAPNTTYTMPDGDAVLTAVYTDKTKTQRTLTVKGGTGSGKYKAGTIVPISADTSQSDKAFEAWNGNTAYLDNPACANAYVTIPAADIELQASYRTVTGATRTLTVVDGLGSGSYKAGDIITISAKPLAGESWYFDVWTGNVAGISNVSFPITTFIMPSYDATVIPNFKAKGMENYALSVEGGTGSGSFKAGVMASIAADTPPDGYIFDIWQGDTSSMANPSASATIIKVPRHDMTVKATYKLTGGAYTLGVANGSGSGSYSAGNTVAVTAAAAPEGQVFAGWSGNTAYLLESSLPSTTLVMPSANVSITATYRSTEGMKLYTLTVLNGFGSGTYPEGTPVTITADAPPRGKVFDLWKPQVSDGVTNQSANLQAASPSTILVMPAQDMSVKAIYRQAASDLSFELTVKTDEGLVIQQGKHEDGETVAVAAPERLDDGRIFNAWSGAAVANVGAWATTLAMPAADTTLVATYRAGDDLVKVIINDGENVYTVTVQRGSVLTLSALQRSAEGLLFCRWSSAELGILQTQSIAVSANVDMNITAEYLSVDSSYLLELSSSSSGYATPSPRGSIPVGFGQSVDIWMDDIEGYKFREWQVVSGEASVVSQGGVSGLATVTPSSDASLLALISIGLTRGSVFSVNASEINLDSFKRKPWVAAFLESSDKRIGNLCVLTKGYNKQVVETVDCLWTRNFRLYKTAELNKLLREGVLTVDAMKTLLPDGFVDSKINLKVNQDGKKWTGEARVQALFMPVAKSMEAIAGTATSTSNGSVAASGLVFGRAPMIYVEYKRQGSDRIRYRRCRVDNKSFIYKDCYGRPSPMDPSSGESYLRFTYPKLWDSDTPTGYIIIDNRLARSAFEFKL